MEQKLKFLLIGNYSATSFLYNHHTIFDCFCAVILDFYRFKQLIKITDLTVRPRKINMRINWSFLTTCLSNPTCVEDRRKQGAQWRTFWSLFTRIKWLGFYFLHHCWSFNQLLTIYLVWSLFWFFWIFWSSPYIFIEKHPLFSCSVFVQIITSVLKSQQISALRRDIFHII